MRNGLTFTGFLLVAAILSDSWAVEGVDHPSTLPGYRGQSVLKHEVLVARTRPRNAAGATVRLPRSRSAARLPHPASAVGPRIEHIGSLHDHPASVDPAAWLGRRHLRSPS